MGPAELSIELVYSPAPAQVRTLALHLVAGATVQAALDASGWSAAWPEIASLDCGIWGRRVARETLLRDGDRVEVYRPLQVEPKEARRLRARRASTPAGG